MYHVNIINLFHPLLDSSSSIEYPRSSYRHRARWTKQSSLKEIRRLLALQETRHGWVDAITLVLHPITVASVGNLEEISLSQEELKTVPLESSEPYLGLLTCLRALDSLSSYSYYAQPLFRLLTQKCQAFGLQLPAEVQSTLRYYTSEEWTKTAALLVSSQYIADMHKTATDIESVRMDAIISGWENLSFDEAGKGKARAI